MSFRSHFFQDTNYNFFSNLLFQSLSTLTQTKKKLTILYNKLQYIVLQSCYKRTIKCESNVEYNLTS